MSHCISRENLHIEPARQRATFYLLQKQTKALTTCDFNIFLLNSKNDTLYF